MDTIDKDILLLSIEASLHTEPCLKFGDYVSYFLCNMVWLYMFSQPSWEIPLFSIISLDLNKTSSLICNQILCDCM